MKPPVEKGLQTCRPIFQNYEGSAGKLIPVVTPTVTSIATIDAAPENFIHEFTDIEPLHQPKASDGSGGHAPILFADLHVAKV
ncbi:MAG: hypothetical protein ACO3F3_19850, partial [Gemmataceae bacterium]